MVVLLSALLSFRPALRFCSDWDWLPWGFPDVGVSAVPVQCLPPLGTRGELLPCPPTTGKAGAQDQRGRTTGDSCGATRGVTTS